MAQDSIMGNLFGVSPAIYEQNKEEATRKQALEFSKLDPYERTNALAFIGGRGLGNIVGGALGAQDPVMMMLSQRAELGQQFDLSTPTGFKSLAKELLAKNDPQGAQIALQKGSELELRESQITKNLRERQGAEPIQQLIRAGKYTPASVAEYEQSGDIGKLVSIEKQGAMPSMVQEYQFAKTPEGGGFKGSYQEFVTARALAGRAPAQPRPEQPPVPVVDPKTGKVILVSREEAITGRLTPAASMEGLSPKEIQLREAKFPQAKTAVASFETSAEKLAKDLETLANSKGLEGITGLIGGRTPAITKEARAAEALYNSIVARGGFNELQNIRASSPTGGALGNVSNVEGQNLRDAYAPLKLTQNASDLRGQLLKAAQETRASVGRIKETFDMTYEYKNQGGQQGGQVGAKADPLGIR
jgi:hypothetical protein